MVKTTKMPIFSADFYNFPPKYLEISNKVITFAPVKKNNEIGALVQLVRIHACHAWGHGFESRTHRKNTRAVSKMFDAAVFFKNYQ